MNKNLLIKRRNEKKAIIPILSVVLLILCVACNPHSEDEVEENQGDEMQNYVLKISTDKQIYENGEDIIIDITLKNQSGADIEIGYYFLFYPESFTGQFPEYEVAPVTTKRLFKNGETIHETARLGECFLVGHHELKYRAVFYLTWKMTEFGYENTDDMIEVWSNTVEISVIEA